MPYRVTRFPVVGSTNDIAMEAALAGEPPGLVVVADRQLSGKGRKARDWASPEGGLWTSIVLSPDVPALQLGLVPLAVGCAVAEALAPLGVDAGLKWPNDLMVGDRKLAGILVESLTRGETVAPLVAGIGLNVTNPAPVPTATNLAEQGPELGPLAVLERVLSRLPRYEARLGEGDAQWLCERFMERAWGMGRDLLLDGVPCRPREIAVDGALIIERAHDGIDVVRSGSLTIP